jgi:hypothetical protein
VESLQQLLSIGRLWFIPGKRSDFSLRHHIQTGSGAHANSYTVGIEGVFPEDIATGA